MNWNYIAGFFDGEGTFGKYNDNNGYKLSISQSNEKVLKDIQVFTNIGHIYPLKKRKLYWKNAWVYYIAKEEDVYYFLNKISNKLIVKKESVALALPLLERRVKKRKKQKIEIAKRIKRAKFLRRRGLSYRQIGKKLDIDWGYARRMILGLK